MKLSSGYILSAFDEYLRSHPSDQAVIQKLCNFEVKSGLIKDEYHQIGENLAPLAVLNNIIVRGFPTFSSLFIEEQLVELSEELEFEDSSKLVLSKLNDLSGTEVFDKLTANRGVTKHLQKSQKLQSDSSFEYSLFGLLEDEFGEWIHTILCQQVPITDLAPGALEYVQQRVDFLIPFPMPINDIKGFVIEMDGGQHQDYGETDLDKRRNNILLHHGYATIRIAAGDSHAEKLNKLQQLRQYLDHEVFKSYKRSDAEPDELVNRLIILPLAIGRVQLSVVKGILSNPEWLNEPSINIAVIEDEDYLSGMAIDDLNQWVSHLSVLTENSSLPIFSYDVFKNAGEIEDSSQYHAVVDISMYHSMMEDEPKEFPNSIVIRNAPLYQNADRTITTGPHIKFKEFGTFENSNWEETEPDRVESLRYFLRSLFRKKDFRKGQLPILNRALTGQSVIGLLPTGGGKSLTYQLSALMHPGVCMVIDPIISLMRDQVKGLRNHWIDACHFINSSIKTREKKVEIQKKISDGKALFFFISPERLLIEDFRSYLHTMSKDSDPVYYNYCVIDEAHCVSEWGHDFRTSYLSVAENAMRYCITHPEGLDTIPIFALTATASYDVLTDIQRELSGNDMSFRIGEEAIVELDEYTRDELTFKIQEIDSKDLYGAKGFDLKKKLSEKKNEYLKEILLRHDNDLKDQAGLIFTPHRSHYFGITDRFKPKSNGNGVLDNLRSDVGRLSHKMGFFMGSDDENKSVQDISLTNQDKFLSGELNLLVATKAFGMGIDKNDIRFTVHYNYPSSIESFLQEAGRAGRDEEPSSCYLLYTNPNSLEQDVEFEVNEYFHKSTYKGADKEKSIIEELLHKIHEPDRTYELTADIQDEFGIEAVVTIWTSKSGNRYISVQESFNDKVGDIMIRGNDFPIYFADEVKNGTGTYSREEANKIIYYVKNKIITKGNPNEVWDWINSSGGTREGILQVMQMPNCTQVKYSGKMELAWENNIRERIKWIQLFVKDSLKRKGKKFQDSYIENVVSSAVKGKGSAINFDDFVNKIDSGLSKYKYDLYAEGWDRDQRKGWEEGTTMEGLMEFYNQVRDKADTEKALYRLRLLGVLDDYTVDYRTNMFTLYLSNKSDQFYEDRVRHYLSKFYSEDRVNRELKKIEGYTGNSIIQKYLKFLVDFGYEQIAEKRARSIIDMKEACKYGLERTPKDLAEYLTLYLNSKYFREEYLVNDVNESLSYNLDKGKIIDPKFIWHYIDLMLLDGNSEVNNLKHLRGASLRMLRATPDNPVLLTLAAYSTFFLEYQTPNLLNEAEENLMTALDYYEEVEGWEEAQLEALFDKLVEILKTKRPDITDYYEFEFENFRLNAINKSLKSINGNLDYLNKKLLTYG
ncbi:MAG: hypothetical protein CL666_03835 [Balneola sp.]|nr:hypothetical protein [Balneola sp.]|tara:strand:- start:72705 stop:76835 length:4131 start_codon:yes stop_codon:yes gene_type:complete